MNWEEEDALHDLDMAAEDLYEAANILIKNHYLIAEDAATLAIATTKLAQRLRAKKSPS